MNIDFLLYVFYIFIKSPSFYEIFFLYFFVFSVYTNNIAYIIGGINMIKFGTGGWRAVIAEDFTFRNVKKLGFSMAKYIQANNLNPRVVVGHDLRFLSGRFSRALSEALAENNIEVLFIDRAVPTPMVMHAVEIENLDMGATVTASHNPPEYNGVKVFIKKGKDAPIRVTDELENIFNNIDDFKYHRKSFYNLIEEGSIKYYNNTNDFVDSLLEKVSIELIKKQNYNILFNPMYGVARDIMLMCLASLRCTVDTMNAYRDTMFGLKLPTPAEENLKEMKIRMKKANNYSLGIATDGDSDRVAVFDNKGEYFGGNRIILLIYYYLLEYKNESGGIVRDLNTTHMVDKIAKSYNQKVSEVPVGFKHISEEMDKENYLLGGERNGGIKIRNHIYGKDGILPALIFIEMLAFTNKSYKDLLNEIYNKFGKLYYGSKDYLLERIKEKDINFIKPKLKKTISSKTNKKIIKTLSKDGYKLYLNDGTWLSVRFSGTEPLLRVRMEMQTNKEKNFMLNLVESLIKNP